MGLTLNIDFIVFKLTCHFLCFYGVSMRLSVLLCSFHHHLCSGSVFKTPIICIIIVINTMNTMNNNIQVTFNIYFPPTTCVT